MNRRRFLMMLAPPEFHCRYCRMLLCCTEHRIVHEKKNHKIAQNPISITVEDTTEDRTDADLFIPPSSEAMHSSRKRKREINFYSSDYETPNSRGAGERSTIYYKNRTTSATEAEARSNRDSFLTPPQEASEERMMNAERSGEQASQISDDVWITPKGHFVNVGVNSTPSPRHPPLQYRAIAHRRGRRSRRLLTPLEEESD